MTTYYVGPGGSDASDGLSWANRKLTLNGVEDVPVAAGDTVYVGPGVYRETLTCDVAGTSGNPISYIGDVTGENTDGVGGVVRISGSDDDRSATRGIGIDVGARNFRSFRGLAVDLCSTEGIDASAATDLTVEDCSFSHLEDSGIEISGDSQANLIVRRCLFLACHASIQLTSSSGATGTNHLIENCLFIASRHDQIRIDTVGGNTIKNCTFIGSADDHVDVSDSAGTGAGQFTDVNNCIFVSADSNALEAAVSGDIVEDYNTFFNNSADRSLVSVGTNSKTDAPLFALPLLSDGFVLPFPLLGELSEWSQVRALAGTGEATDDFFGRSRPATSAKKSWGALQFSDSERSVAAIGGDSNPKLLLNDAGRVQFKVPVDGSQITVGVDVHREDDYGGSNPQLIVKQPGAADDVTTDAGGAQSWNTLSTTLTPNASPGYVIVELVSNNTAATGNYATYWRDITVD